MAAASAASVTMGGAGKISTEFPRLCKTGSILNQLDRTTTVFPIVDPHG